MKSHFYFLLCLLAVILQASCKGQDTNSCARVMFWNLENYFDPFDDSLTNDNDYLPDASRHWTWKRFIQKRNNIYKVIMAAGNPEPPAIIGFSEVENRFVLIELLQKTPLMRYEYGIVHKESPDRRGIDAALLYRKDKFRLLEKEFFDISGGDKDFRTREIVYAKGIIAGDTILFFVNHWPSRSGGQAESDDKRCQAGKRLRAIIDSLQLIAPSAKILLMGDFNDTPQDASLLNCLGATVPEKGRKGRTEIHPYAGKPSELINLAGILTLFEPDAGTHKFQGDWAMLDQMIVSGSLLNAPKGLTVSANGFSIFKASFLLVQDDQNVGKKPHRTYNGMRYEGGFSDHLPVLTELVLVP
jgi:endonuclease/exonuclease/phosphatase family metal-dependent hydrolase